MMYLPFGLRPSNRRCSFLLVVAATGAGISTRAFKVCLCNDKHLLQYCWKGLWQNLLRQIGSEVNIIKDKHKLKCYSGHIWRLWDLLQQGNDRLALQ